MKEYFRILNEKLDRAYQIAKKARSLNLDPDSEVEIPSAEDLAARVEELTGPKGVAEAIRELEDELSREELAFRIAEMIVDGRLGEMTEIQAAEQAVRTCLAIITEGIAAAAPIEGITKVEIRKNFDGTSYLALYFAGPIRSAGGTAAALAVLCSDFIRGKLDLSSYDPSSREVERFVEEVNIYSEGKGLQYTPSDEDVRAAVRNIPVEIAGDPTERETITANRDLDRIDTNRVRGGAVLALTVVLQKAPKILKRLGELGLSGWEWLSDLSASSSEDKESRSYREDDKYLEDVIAGRAVLSHPNRAGGFRLRYGRARNTGLAAAGVHPATMRIVDDHISIGTQLKTQYPGKAVSAAPVDALEGPVVKMRDGSVVRVNSIREADEIMDGMDEILSLGDILIGFGEFLENNYRLMPSGYCSEWWAQEVLEASSGKEVDVDLAPYLVPPYRRPSPDLAVKISEELGVPLHPGYTYPFHDLERDEILGLGAWLSEGETKFEDGVLKRMEVELRPENKGVLERIFVPHRVDGDKVVIGDEALTLCRSLGIIDDGGLDYGSLKSAFSGDGDESILDLLEKVTGFPIRSKAPSRVGCRIGRPEKAKPRMMRPSPHVLFPVGRQGGRTRDVAKAAESEMVEVEVANCKCLECGEKSVKRTCPKCGARTDIVRYCPKCRTPREDERCMACDSRTVFYKRQKTDVRAMLNEALGKLEEPLPDEVKGVRGMTSAYKIPEPLEKGVLRAKNGVYVFKDGTVRFDATNIPLTHFRPGEVGVSAEELRELGYGRDFEGRPLESDDQLVELKVQDILLSKGCANYLLRSANFVDDLLQKFYGLSPYYEASDPKDLVGHLVIGLAPHTSAGIVGRIVGITDANVGYAHPYFHSAKRRNCDGDEDAIMLLLDALLNFSRYYLPESRGGSMDAPLVLTTRLDPEEIDEEAYNMDIVEGYPAEFYGATHNFEDPRRLTSMVETVGQRLGSPDQYKGLQFSHGASSISAGPSACRYKSLETMEEKIASQMSLARKIAAVEDRDVAERLIEDHFIPDLKGNMRAFSRQQFQCTTCYRKYRRVPLSGKCICGGDLKLTVSKGSVEKYLQTAMRVAEEYGVSNYIKQRLVLVDEEIKSVFESDTGGQQLSLADFV